MANNSFTKGYLNGTALTEAQLDAAFQSLQMDLTQSAQLTNGASAGQVLTVSSGGSAAIWATPSDPKSPGVVRNYGISASVGGGSLSIALKTAAGTNPTASDIVTIDFSSNGASSAVPNRFSQTASLTLNVTASATLGIRSATTATIYVYAIRVDSTTLKLGVSTNGYLDTGDVQATTLMSSSSDSESVLYSNATASSYPVRLLGWIRASHTSGSWDTIYAVNIVNVSSVSQTQTSGYFARIGNVAKSGSTAGAGLITSTTAINVFDSSNIISYTPGTGVNTLTNVITSASSHGGATGQLVYFPTPGSGALPGGISANTDYYLIVTGASTFKLATTYANAILGTPVTLTGKGSGASQSIYYSIACVLSTTGRSVDLSVEDDGTGNAAFFTLTDTTGANGTAEFKIIRITTGGSATTIGVHQMNLTIAGSSATSGTIAYPASISKKDLSLAAGTYVYKLQARVLSASRQLYVKYARLLAAER